MLLAIDIGNTNIAFGIFRGRRLLKRLHLPTSIVSAGKSGAEKLKNACRGYDIDSIIICSVVPKAEKVLSSILKTLFKVKPLVLGKDIAVPMRNLYKSPKQVGQDRLVNAYAGSRIYGAPLIIVDFGTAVTFDVVPKECLYLGGIIAPGIDMSLSALAEKTALLPKIKLKRIPSVLGRTTSESMASGIFHGFSSMCDGLVEKLGRECGCKFKVIATGGNAHVMSKLCKSIDKADDNLILKGMSLIFQHLGVAKRYREK